MVNPVLKGIKAIGGYKTIIVMYRYKGFYYIIHIITTMLNLQINQAIQTCIADNHYINVI